MYVLCVSHETEKKDDPIEDPKSNLADLLLGKVAQAQNQRHRGCIWTRWGLGLQRKKRSFS